MKCNCHEIMNGGDARVWLPNWGHYARCNVAKRYRRFKKFKKNKVT